MPKKKTDGSGTIYQRGAIWWVKVHADGRPVYESSGSVNKSDAIRLRDRMLAKKERGELQGRFGVVLIDELLNDFLVYAKTHVRPETGYIYRKVVERHIRPFFGKLKVQRLTTRHFEDYRATRAAAGANNTTVNRELSLLRIALNNGRKCTPPKVTIIPYFPMTPENNVRTGFLADEQYKVLLDELTPDLKPLFTTAVETGVRRGELLAIRWDQVDFEQGLIVLERTKNGQGRSVPILSGDMEDFLRAAKAERDDKWPACEWVFSRDGEQVRDFRATWTEACKRAGVPDLRFHDLRRTAVRNMRRAGVPQVIRMKISGHKTDSMERRYNIVDSEDLSIAKELMEARKKAVNGASTVTITPQKAKPAKTRKRVKSTK
jgi:integrase